MVRVGLELEQFCLEKDLFEELVHVDPFLCGDLLALVFAAPFLHEDVHIGELFPDLVRVGSRLVYLVDGKDHRHTCSLRVVDGLDGLWHYRVICGDDDNGDVCHLGSAGTHSGEGFVSRRVEECYPLSVRQYHVVCTDVLRDSSCLSGDHVGFPDVVQQGGLSVVDVSHHGHYRRSWYEVAIILGIVLLGDGLVHLRCDEFYFVSELLRHQHEGLGIEPLVDRYHKPEVHTGSYDFGHRCVHQGGEIVDSHEFGDFEHFLLELLHLHLFLHLLRCQLPLLFPVLCSEVVLSLAFVHPGVCLLDLLLDLLLHLFRLGLGHCRLETVASLVPAVLLVFAEVFLPSVLLLVLASAIIVGLDL